MAARRPFRAIVAGHGERPINSCSTPMLSAAFEGRTDSNEDLVARRAHPGRYRSPFSTFSVQPFRKLSYSCEEDARIRL